MLMRRLARSMKDRFFPSEHQLMVRKWWADGGDYAFRFNYELDENSVVLDIGGYHGQWASDLFARYRCPIFIFEPVTSFADRIRDRYRRNDRIQVFPYGLGGSSRRVEMNLADDGSSIFGKSGKNESIDIVDVAEWMEKRLKSGSPIDLMKINIEGGEYELLDRLIETGLITRIRNIQVQFHQVSPHSLRHMEKIQTAMMNSHQPTYQYAFVWENWKRRDLG